jgi:hypothetical protein
MAKHARVRRRSTLRRAGLLLSGVTVPLVWALSAPAEGALLHQAGDRSATMTVADAAEAWYAATPIDLCTSPLGCPPSQVPTSPYPADTLHVGTAGGQETARTYLLPDLTTLPVGATAVGGTMTLPLATDSQAGTQSPDTARMVACLATKPVPDGAQGSTAAPPSIDCKVTAKLTFDAKKGLFHLDLTPFLTAWHSGAVPDGIALVRDSTSAQPSDAWHVAFNGRKRARVAHISSAVTYTLPVTSTGGGGTHQPAPPPPVVPVPAPVTGGGVALPPSTGTGAPAVTPPVVAPQQSAPAPVTQPVALSLPFQYPLAFLTPLALLAAAVFFVRLFTRDPTPMRLQ